MGDYKGIDYGLGQTNIDLETGIRYGVIGMNCEHLSEWAWEEIEPDYGDAHCPKCGNEAKNANDDDAPDFDAVDDDGEELWETKGCREHYCGDCSYVFDGDYAFGDEPVGHVLDDDDYKGIVDSHSDLMLFKSPYYTHTRFCSPCAPGAGHLESPVEGGVKTYALGHGWFRGGKAPYPLFRVSDDSEVKPDE